VPNASAASQTDSGSPSSVAVARAKKGCGMSNRVPPLVAPTSRPRSTISIASVTMKALSRSLTTNRPLRKPVHAPTAAMASSPAATGHSVPKPPEAAGITSMAPTAGAMPTVDSTDRSNLPVMMISDSASTTSARAAEAPRMLTRLAGVRKLGLVKAPSKNSRASAGTSA